jgi:DNA-binding CsgD family transcriptional regulator
MATRGTPIPWNMREAVKKLASTGELSNRKISRELGISHNTVTKYAKPKPK